MNKCPLCNKEKDYILTHEAQTFHGNDILVCNECIEEIMEAPLLDLQE